MNLDKLQIYLRSCSDTQFKLGKHDCFTFTNNAYVAMTGEGWADEAFGNYEGKTRKELSDYFKSTSLLDFINSKMTSCGLPPPRGALVAIKAKRKKIFTHSLGICNGSHCAFVGDVGIEYIPVEHVELGWVK